MHFPEDFYNYVKNNTLIEIKGGDQRETFLEIWMVTVGPRFFARSWNKSERSWFTEFVNSGVGQIKYGDKKVYVTGEKVNKDDAIHELINQAYLAKYNQKENIPYAQGITMTEYADYTLEFFFKEVMEN